MEWNQAMPAKQAISFQNLSLRNAVALPARVLAAAVLMLQLSGEVSAQEGTSFQRHACTPDVFRLCKDFIPDHAQITACLQSHRRMLSHNCRIALFSRAR
jgi:hypothetical protein